MRAAGHARAVRAVAGAYAIVIKLRLQLVRYSPQHFIFGIFQLFNDTLGWLNFFFNPQLPFMVFSTMEFDGNIW